MAMAMQSNESSRFTDISDEPVDNLLAPIRGYEDQSLLPLTETINPISGLFKNIRDNVFVALYNSRNPADDLTQQESASIHLYTMQFPGESSLYTLLNQSLRAENREDLKPWFSFLKLFLTALYKLPSQSQTVWRGIKNVDLSSKYKKGTTFAWWGVSSCTTDLEVLESKQFLGKHGLRTLFSIECINGKSIVNHSYFKNKEKEIILMPGSYFEVMGQLDSGSELHIIQLKEIPPPITFVQPPFSKSTNITFTSPGLNKSNPVSPPLSESTNITSSPPALNKSNSVSPPLSNKTKQHETSNSISKEIPFKSSMNCFYFHKY
jgi:hypothetical protein